MNTTPTIKIDPEFKNLMPPMSEDEFRGLEQLLLANGCSDELVCWGSILLDGHNRLAICEKHNIKYMVRYMDFADRDAAKVWIICNQLSRRNLSSEQISYLRGLRYQIEKKEHGGDRKSSHQNEDLISDISERLKKHCDIWHSPGTTAEKLSKEFGVSKATIERDAKFAEAVDKLPPEEKKEVLSGKSGKTKREIVNPPKAEEETDPGPDESADTDKPRRPGSFQQQEDLYILKKRWESASKATKKEFIRFIEKETAGLPIVPADIPPKYSNFIKRLHKTWMMMPRNFPEMNDSQRGWVEHWATEICRNLEPYDKNRRGSQ